MDGNRWSIVNLNWPNHAGQPGVWATVERYQVFLLPNHPAANKKLLYYQMMTMYHALICGDQWFRCTSTIIASRYSICSYTRSELLVVCWDIWRLIQWHCLSTTIVIPKYQFWPWSYISCKCDNISCFIYKTRIYFNTNLKNDVAKLEGDCTPHWIRLCWARKQLCFLTGTSLLWLLVISCSAMDVQWRINYHKLTWWIPAHK